LCLVHQRMTALYAVQVLSEALTEDVVTSEVLPLVLKMGRDPVANIRFTVARTLEKIAPKVCRELVVVVASSL
jgi:serine/threonine-protein phosphatase 2A regulatory subunit A